MTGRNTNYKELKDSVEASLLSCTTSNQLEEAWSEYINHMDGVSNTCTAPKIITIVTTYKE